MSYQEKNSFVMLVSSIVVFGTYYIFVSRMFFEGRFDGPEGASLLGKAILVLIFGGIIVTIIISVLFQVFQAMITRNEKPSYLVDERDRLIELRALRVAYFIIGAGFIFSMIALAMGYAVFTVFNMIILSFFVAGIVEGLTQIVLYRRGF